VVAAVVPEDGAEVDPEELRAFVRGQLSTYKVPTHVVVVAEDEVPWTASHKVRRGVLAQLLAARLGLAPAAP
jgi:fatty-acyl-CoA synthase